MGFFDSVLPADKSGFASGQSSGTASGQASVAVVEAPQAAAAASDSDFLIIDESVSVANVPDTVVSVNETPASSDLIILDAADEVPSTVEAPVSEISAPAEEVVVPATEEVSAAPVLDFSSMDSVSAPVVEESPVVAIEPVVEAVEETPASMGFLSVVSETPKEESAPVSDSLDPDAILASTVLQLKGVVSSKESARDTAMAENEKILSELAAEEEAFKARKSELKKRASEAQERAREIDASADRARSLISNLEAQLARAA